jgi:hypothetical protein
MNRVEERPVTARICDLHNKLKWLIRRHLRRSRPDANSQGRLRKLFYLPDAKHKCRTGIVGLRPLGDGKADEASVVLLQLIQKRRMDDEEKVVAYAPSIAVVDAIERSAGGEHLRMENALDR